MTNKEINKTVSGHEGVNNMSMDHDVPKIININTYRKNISANLQPDDDTPPPALNALAA